MIERAGSQAIIGLGIEAASETDPATVAVGCTPAIATMRVSGSPALALPAAPPATAATASVTDPDASTPAACVVYCADASAFCSSRPAGTGMPSGAPRKVAVPAAGAEASREMPSIAACRSR